MAKSKEDLLKQAADLTETLCKAAAKIKGQKKPQIQVLIEPHAEKVWKGQKTLVVHSSPIKVAGLVRLADDSKIYGEIALAKCKPISLAEFRRRQKEHGISEEERKSWWPRSRRLYAHAVKKFEAYDKPQVWTRPVKATTPAPRYSREPKIVELVGWGMEEKADVLRALRLAKAFSRIAPGFVDQAAKYMKPTPVTLGFLEAIKEIGPLVVDAYEKLVAQLKLEAKNAETPNENIFETADMLSAALQRNRAFLPRKTLVWAVGEDATAFLEHLLTLESEFVEGMTLPQAEPLEFSVDSLYKVDDSGWTEVAKKDLFLEKAEPPRGKLPVLKVPDPTFNIRRLTQKKTTGILSRVKREKRTGIRQFLVNEMEPTKADAAYIWGVVVLEKPEEIKSLAELSDEQKAGLDQFTREEFSAEEAPIYYLPMELAAAFAKPLKLKKPPEGRRFGPVISIPEALAKGEITTADVPTLHPQQIRGLPFRGLSPDKLKELSDTELVELYELGQMLLATVFVEGKTTANGLSLEDVENALQFIRAELKGRKIDVKKAGPTERYAPVYPGHDPEEEQDVLKLNDVLPHFHEEFLLRAPFVHLVGSMCNFGETSNDIDLLIKGPLDEVTNHVMRLRLGRMLPPEISQRVHYHGGCPEHEEEDKVSMAGPFSAHLPLYDLVVRRRDDYRVVIEMRDSGMRPEDMTTVVEKQSPFLKLPPSEKPKPSALQIHFRGKTAHADLRIKANGHLIGYTMSIQIAGKVPDVDELAEAKRIAEAFKPSGSVWNKPLEAPGRVFVEPKPPIPLPWLKINAEAFKPGSVGATRFKPGYIVTVARPQVSYGERTSVFHEYFLEKDPKLQGLLTFRLLTGRGAASEEDVGAGRKTPQGATFWTGMLSKSLLPYMLKPRAVKKGRIPPQGWAYLPPGLKAAVPKQFRYWLPKDEKERKEIRDALVKERFFTDANIKMVDGRFRRVVTKYYLYQPPVKEQEEAEVEVEPLEDDPIAILAEQAKILDEAVKAVRQEAKGKEKEIDSNIVYSIPSPPTAVDYHDRDKACQGKNGGGVKKQEKVKAITLDGEKVENVQVWDPKDIKPDDDKAKDRERLRPPALYQPMKVAPRAGNEFRSNELGRIFEDFATPERLKAGIATEPKYNGWRVSLQRDSKGNAFMISEEVFERKTELRNFLKNLPAVEKAAEEIPGPYILDAEFTAVNKGKDPVPRRELAEFRGKGKVDDQGVRLKVFDILYHPKEGNVVARPYTERRRLLAQLLKGKKSKHIELAPFKIAKSKKDLLTAFTWARRIPGSEGAMLKSMEHTVSLGGHNDLMAKVKAIRRLKGIVWDKHPVKDSPGVFNFMYAVGPIDKKDVDEWAETVEIGNKTYVKAGRTFNSKVKAKVGDTIRIEVTEILLDRSKAKKRLRGFTPVVIDVADEKPSSVSEVLALLEPGETKKSADTADDVMGRAAVLSDPTLKIFKKNEEERFVKGIVLVPEEEDSQGDIYSADEVRKACHWFMEHARKLGLMHETTLSESKICILENYIEEHDGEVEGGQFVKKGTWVLAARVVDPELWQAVKDGELTGWSIEGSAIAQALN
jgi:hypothetical protein